MIFTLVHLDLLIPLLPYACQASQVSKTVKDSKNKGKTKFNIKILWPFSFLGSFGGAYVRKGQGGLLERLIFEILCLYFYFVWAISSISFANDFVFDQEFDRMIAPF